MSESGKDVNLGLSLSGEYSDQQNDGKREKIGSPLFFIFFFPDQVFHLELKKKKKLKKVSQKSLYLPTKVWFWKINILN